MLCKCPMELEMTRARRIGFSALYQPATMTQSAYILYIYENSTPFSYQSFLTSQIIVYLVLLAPSP